MPLPYFSNVVYPLNNLVGNATASTPAEDWLAPFTPHTTVSIDGVAWLRDITTAANVYVGIYNAAGSLLTDCAVDADTVVGTKVIATTPVTLTKGQKYYFAWNASADCASHRTNADASATFSTDYGIEPDLAAAATIGGTIAASTVGYSKARANAALPSTQTMSGWTVETIQVAMGFRVV